MKSGYKKWIMAKMRKLEREEVFSGGFDGFSEKKVK